MGQACLSKPVLPPPPTDFRLEVQRSSDILRLQETEVDQQTLKAGLMLKQISVLIASRPREKSVLRHKSPVDTIRPLLELSEENLGTVQETNSACRQECSSLRAQLKLVTARLEANPGSSGVSLELQTVQVQLAAVHHSLTNTHNHLKRMETDIEQVLEMRQEQEMTRLYSVQQRTNRFEGILRVPIHWFDSALIRAFWLWKAASGSKPPQQPLLRPSFSPSKAGRQFTGLTEESTESDIAPYEAILDEGHFLVATNPLNSAISDLETVVSLPCEQLSELLSQILMEKAREDEGRRESGGEPWLFPHFLAHFCAQSSRKLREIVKSVALMQAAGREIGLLWAALLHLDVKTTVLTQTSHNLTRLLAPFQALSNTQAATPPCPLLEEQAYLADIISFLGQKLASDPTTGETVLNAMKPEGLTEFQFTCFKLGHWMELLKVDALGIFRHLDTEGKGRIDIQQLATGLKSCLGVWMSDLELLHLLEYLDTDQTGEVSRRQFQSLSRSKYQEQAQTYLISIQSFLLGLVRAGLKKAVWIVKQAREKLQWGVYVTERQFREGTGKAFSGYEGKQAWKYTAVLMGKEASEVPVSIALRALLRYPPACFSDPLLFPSP